MRALSTSLGTSPRKLAAVMLLALLALAVPRLHAQPAPGDTIRLELTGRRYVRGAFVSADSAGLRLTPLAGGESSWYAESSIIERAILRATHRRGVRSVLQVAGRGAEVGLALGVAIVASSGQGSSAEGVGLALAAMPLLGASVGTLLGALMTAVPDEEWETFTSAAAPARAPADPPVARP